MSDKLTLVCVNDTWNSMRDGIELTDGAEIEADDGDVIRVHIGDRTILFTALRRERPMDRFSKIVLGMSTFFGNLASDELQSRLASTELFIGVVIDPSIDDNTELMMMNTAEHLDALIFNGESLLDSRGDVLATGSH